MYSLWRYVARCVGTLEPDSGSRETVVLCRADQLVRVLIASGQLPVGQRRHSSTFGYLSEWPCPVSK